MKAKEAREKPFPELLRDHVNHVLIELGFEYNEYDEDPEPWVIIELLFKSKTDKQLFGQAVDPLNLAVGPHLIVEADAVTKFEIWYDEHESSAVTLSLLKTGSYEEQTDVKVIAEFFKKNDIPIKLDGDIITILDQRMCYIKSRVTADELMISELKDQRDYLGQL